MGASGLLGLHTESTALLAGFEEAAAALAKVLDCPVEELPADTMRALINDTSKSPLELAMLARLLQKELVKPSPAPQLAVSLCSACAAPAVSKTAVHPTWAGSGLLWLSIAMPALLRPGAA